MGKKINKKNISLQLIHRSTITLLLSCVGILGLLISYNFLTNRDISQASYDTDTRVTSINTSSNSQLVGVNSRKEPCSTEIVGVIKWGQQGTLVESEGKSATCVGKTQTWYHVQWDDGTKGWTIGSYLDFDIEEQNNK